MEEKLIDIEAIWGIFKKRLWIIILITTVMGGLGAYRASKMVPRYTTRVDVFMGVNMEQIDYSALSQMNFYARNISTLKDMLLNEAVVGEILKANNIDKDPGAVFGSISIQSSEDSPIFSMTYSSGSKEGMAESLDAVTKGFVDKLKEIIPETNPSIINSATVSTIMPNKKRVVYSAVLVGLVISIGLILVIDYLDDRIKSKEDLEKLLPIPVLGDLPVLEKEFLKGEKIDASNS